MTRTIKVIVKEIIQESPTVKSFKLAAADGSLLPRFSAGSHITTYLNTKNGVIERHYSLTTDPDISRHYQIAIRRSDQSKGGSIYWYNQVAIGDHLDISYPKNHFPLSFSAKHHVFFAAGIGITPFLSMAAALKKNGKSFELHYAAPSKKFCAFYNFLSATYPAETHFYFSKDGNRMTPHLMKNQAVGTHVYFCGTEAMVREFTDAAKAFGYPEKSIHYELFSPPDSGPLNPFQIKLNKSKQIIEVPEGKSLLETLLENSIQAPYSCKIGGCGTCQIDVLDGEVDHRDFFLSDSEKKEGHVILTCVSRAKKGCLVLDM